jgi:hypothetical protein
MRIVKLSSLSEKERKKVLEEQEERYQQNQSERQKIQEEANNNFFNKFGTGETQTSHTTTYQNILNAMESREAKKDFERRNGLTLWDQVKRMASDISRIGQNIGIGVTGGVKDFIDRTQRARLEEQKQRTEIMYSPYKLLENSSDEKAKKVSEFGLEKYAQASNKTQQDITTLQQENKRTRDENQRKIAENISQQSNTVTKKLAELSPSLGNMGIGMLASAVNPIAGATYFTGSASQSYYYDALDRGMTEEQASTYGDLMGALEGVTEMIGVENIKAGGQAIKGLVKGTGKQALKTATKETTKAGVKEALKQFGIGIADNFVQESIMEPLQEFTALSVAGKDKADFSNMGQRMLQSGIDGALTSIIMSGAEAGASTCTGLVEKVQNGEKVTQTEVQNAIKDAQTRGVDTTKLTEDSMSYWMNKAKDIINQNTDNQVINQETKTAQNQTSQEQNDIKTQTTTNLAKVKQFYDEDTYNQMKNFIETAPSEQALNQINEDIKTETKNRLEETYKSERFTESQERKRTFAKYQREKNTNGIQYNSDVVNKALDTVSANRNGRRTVGQWKQVAEQIGLEASNLPKTEIDDIAYGSWFDLQPTKNITKYDNRTKEHKGFEKFTSDDWINTIYESAKGQKLQQLDTVLNSDIANNQEKPNIINEKVNQYIEDNKNSFNTNINIETKVLNNGDKAYINYDNVNQSGLAKKAQSFVDKFKTRIFKNNNEEIHVSNSDIKKSISETLKNKEQNIYKKENVAVFSQLDKVIENAKLLDVANEHKGREYYSDYKYYVSNVYIDEKPFVVEFDTRMQDSGNGTMERHFRLERVYPLNNNEVVSNTAPKINSDHTFLNETTSINNSIPQNNQNVKGNTINNNVMQNNQNNTLVVQKNNKKQTQLPLKQINQNIESNTQNTKGETINWNEIERPENNQKFRKHYKSIIESSQTTAEAKSIAKDLMGTDTYVPETNKGQLAQADQRIMTSSPETELQSLLSRAMNGEKISSVDIAVGERLIQYFSKTGSKEQLQEAIQATAMAGTSAGQTVQALSMLNHQTPQGQATWIQRSVDKMNKELAKRKGGTITTDSDGNVQVINKQGKDITNKVDLFNLTPEMIDKIMNSENQEQMYKNIDEVYEELGQQVPKNTLEKIDTWRYFSMLANIRTHARNMIGNVAMGKMQRVKDKLAGGIEDVVSKFNPELERTKTLRRADKKTKEFAKQDFKNADVQSRLELNENKYNPQSRLQNARRTFKSDVMENTLGRLFNLNDTLLEAEDGLGLKAGYQKALSDYITANKINVDNITDAQLSKARNYAIQQAKEATFHQANAIASAVTQFQNKNNVTKFFVDAVLPFKKTPMNVAKSGMEYSPLQIAKSATLDLVNLRKGKISINQYIDNLSKGMTGTGIALAGYALAKAGILKASGGDDKDKEKYDEEQGKQSYSIEIAGKTYSLDWLAPTGIPLFVGAETFKLFNQEETEKSTEKSSEEDRLKQAIKGASNLLNAGATAVNPMSEMSMISGLTNALASYNTSDNLGSLGNIMTNAGKSYVNQFFPTLMGQVAKTGDEYERTTKSTATGTIGKAVDQTINQIKNKVPGLRQTLPIKTDIWGKDVKQEVNLPLRAFNNFINPATVKDVSTDKVDAELNKLYDVNKNKDLLPDILTKTIQLNNQTYRLSNKEYAEATKNYGQNSYKLIGDFIKTSDYNNLTQEQKETAISNIYSYVKEQNKIEYAKKVNEDVKSSTLYDTMEEIKEKGGNQSEYLNYLSKTKGLEKESEKNKVLADSKYSNKTKEIIYTNGAGKDDKLYNNLLSKSDINMTEYLKYKNKVSEKAFKADKDKKGKTITGSAKNKLVKYLNSNVTGAGNRLLIAGNSYALSNSERQSLSTYINKIASTKDEKIEIYKQLDKNFVVNKGKVYMKVSKK